jgi:hypothetical protein
MFPVNVPNGSSVVSVPLAVTLLMCMAAGYRMFVKYKFVGYWAAPFPVCMHCFALKTMNVIASSLN